MYAHQSGRGWGRESCFFMFILRERENKWGRSREREKEHCQHRVQCGARTHELWDHDLNRSQTLDWVSHPGAPRKRILSRFHCQCRAWHRAWSHDLGIRAWVEIMRQTLNPLSHPGAPELMFIEARMAITSGGRYKLKQRMIEASRVLEMSLILILVEITWV